MWLTEAIKEQTGVRIHFKAAIYGSQLQIYEILRIISTNMGTQVCEKKMYLTHIHLLVLEEFMLIINCMLTLR